MFSLSCDAGSLAIHSHSDSKPVKYVILTSSEISGSLVFPSLLFPYFPTQNFHKKTNTKKPPYRQSSLTRRGLGCIAWPKQGPPARGWEILASLGLAALQPTVLVVSWRLNCLESREVLVVKPKLVKKAVLQKRKYEYRRYEARSIGDPIFGDVGF